MSPMQEDSPNATTLHPDTKKKKWEYLNALEESPRLSRWDYLNSLNSDPIPIVPNLAAGELGSDMFDDEPSRVKSGRHSRFAFVKYMLCNRRVCIAAGLIVLLSAFVSTAIVLGLRSNRAKSKGPGAVAVGASANVYDYNEEIFIKVVAGKPKSSYWIGIWQADKAPGLVFTESDTPSAMWMDLCTGGDGTCTQETDLQFSDDSGWKSGFDLEWPLCDGKWAACVIDNDTNENIACSEVFAVVGGTCDGVCRPATSELSKIEHLNPTPMSPLSKSAFGSCFDAEKQIDSRLWQHMREVFQPDLWVWLGDNAYADGEDIEVKRATYNANKQDLYYTQYGPVADPMIPVTGTW
jgi:hypothetical protein